MGTKVTIHFKNERADRATYISQTVGFGEIIHSIEGYNQNVFQIKEITETGVIIVRDGHKRIITMYIAKPEQVLTYYRMNNLGRVPQWLAAKVKKNWQKGYTQNQPNFK